MVKSEAWYAAMHARKGKGTNQFTKAKELGLPVPPGTMTGKIGSMKGKKHSEETKKLISEKRRKFLKENPDKVPYLLNHYSKGRSYPEEYWKGILDTTDLEYQEQFQVGTYHLDFAFLNKKIDLEIDGDQHYLDVRVIESDKRRTKWLEEQGWTIIRIKWSEYQTLKNKKGYVKHILEQLD